MFVCTGHGYLSELVIPIIENTPHEEDLADSLGEAISKYPKATAVLVRRHGIYIWGPTWMAAKTQAECYHYLFKLALEMHRLGIDYTQVSGAEAFVLESRRGDPHIKPEDWCGTQTTHVKGSRFGLYIDHLRYCPLCPVCPGPRSVRRGGPGQGEGRAG